ncbi:MAG: lysostaphin resistance A-like protein [Phycisphaerales bacterium]
MADAPEQNPLHPPTEPHAVPAVVTADEGTRERDPGTRTLARVLGVAAILLLGVVFVMQQFGGPGAPASTVATDPNAIAAPSDQFVILSKLTVKLGAEFRKMGPKYGTALMTNVDEGARTPEDELRAAVVAAEVVGVAETRPRFQEIADAHPKLAQDAGDLAAALAAPPDEATMKRLRQRHGWFARLAAVRSLPDSDPARQAIVGGGAGLMALLVVAMVIGGLAMLAGFVLFIIGAVLLGSGRLRRRLDAPAPGGSLGIEIVVAFIAGFIALKGLSSLVAAWLKPDENMLTLLTLGAQWLLLLLLLYPRLRYPRTRSLARLGWHRGEGVLKEIGCGIVGYLAMLPIFAACVLVTFVIILLRGAIYQASGRGEPPVPENPIFEVIARGSGSWLIVLIFALATVWAPVMEETVFRGGLYRFLRGFGGVLVAAIASAAAFGFMHSYEWYLLMPVIGLGFSFALMREWRGSLIGPVTAHALHNGTVLILVITMLTMLGE